MELEHALGCTIRPSSCHAFPQRPNTFGFLAGGCIVVGDVHDVHSQAFLRGHDDDITCLAVSMSGALMCSGQQGRNADVIVWDANTQRIIHRITEHDNAVVAVAFSPDDKLLVTVGADRRIIVWDVSNGGIVVHTSVPLGGGETLVAAAWGGRVQDVKRRETEEYHFCVVTSSRLLPFRVNPVTSLLAAIPIKLGTFARRMNCLVYSNYGDVLFVASDTGDIAVITCPAYAVADVVPCCSGGVRALWMSPDLSVMSQTTADASAGGYQYARFGPTQRRYTTLYAAGGDGTITTFKIDDHNALQMYIAAATQLPSGIVSLAGVLTDTASLVLVAVSQDGAISTVAIHGSSVPTMTHLLSSPCTPVIALITHPTDSTRFLSSTADCCLRQWDLNSYLTNGLIKYSVVNTTCHAMQYVRSFEILVCAWSNGNVVCYDGPTLQPLWEKDKAHRTGISQICVDKGARSFATSGHEGEVRVWDLRTKELVQEYKEHRMAVTSMAQFEDGAHYLTASRDRSIMMWDARCARRVACFEHPMGSVNCAALCPNQTNFYTAGMDHKIYLWDLRSREPVRGIRYSPTPGSEAVASTMALSGNGRFLALGGTDQLVHLWRESSQEVVRVGVAHSGSVTNLKFTADGRQVVSGGQDGCIMVWNVYDEAEF